MRGPFWGLKRDRARYMINEMRFNQIAQRHAYRVYSVSPVGPLLWLKYCVFKKSLGVHKILVRKIWFYAPFRKGPNMRKNCRKSSKLILFPGGRGNTILWTKRFYGHLGVSECFFPSCQFTELQGQKWNNASCRGLIWA